MSNDKKETWFDTFDPQVALDAMKTQFPNEMKFGEFLFHDSKNNLGQNVVIIKTYNGILKNFYFNQFGYIGYNNMGMNNHADMFSDVRYTKAWFEIMSALNKGRLIEGKTYEDAFLDYHKSIIEDEYESRMEQSRIIASNATTNKNIKLEKLDSIIPKAKKNVTSEMGE